MFSEIEELRIIAKSTNVAIIFISGSNLHESALEPEIQIDDYKILQRDRNRHKGFSKRDRKRLLRNLLPYSKPVTVGTIYRPPNQSNFLEVLNEKMNKIDSISNEIYILGDFNINLSLNDFYIF